MPTPMGILPGDEDEGINFRLWIGILVPPLAGGMNTLVGYMVSNYDCNVHNRHLVLMVNILSALLCVIAGVAAYSTRRKFEAALMTTPTPCCIHVVLCCVWGSPSPQASCCLLWLEQRLRFFFTHVTCNHDLCQPNRYSARSSYLAR